MNYSDLQASVTNWAARSDSLTVAEVPNFIAFATDSFNHGIPERTIAPLRVREMETTVDLTPASGVCTLPDDYLQYRRVVELASIRRELTYIAPSYADQQYPDRAGGLACNFTITGSSLYTFPVSEADIELLYYRTIPALSNDDTSNWLLAKLPALYLHASLYHLGMFTKDNELIQRSAAQVASMIDGLNMTGLLAVYARAGTRMGMRTP